MKLAIDPALSKLVIRTRATGMLARLAHDLELAATTAHGTIEVEALEGGVARGAWSGSVEIAVDAFRVAGTLHGDRLDASALSPSDRTEIEHKIVAEVFPAVRTVTAEVRGDGMQRGEVAVRAGSARVTAPVRDLVLRPTADGALTVLGRCELSLKALGAREVKGPLGAFKVADAIVVLAELTLRPA